MSNMFEYCSKLTNLDLSSFDTSSVTDMNSMFNECSKLTSLDLSKFNTGKVINVSWFMFRCVPSTIKIRTNSNTATWLKEMFSFTDANIELVS